MAEEPSLSAVELLGHFLDRSLSPVEVLRSTLDRIDQLDPIVNAFVVDREAAIAAARQSETRWFKGEPAGLLDGVPVTVKENMWTHPLSPAAP